LARVDWYTPLTTRNDDVGMFKVKRAKCRQVQHSSAIPIIQIARSCHLLPVFG
ncbi:hypothetical protein EV122DRAFT_225929, partial [Schizophyllum commune]